MVNVKYLVKGQGAFFYGFIYMLVSTYFIIPIISVGNSIMGSGSSEVEAIAWLIMLVLFLFLTIIVPANWTYMGITEKQENEPNKFMLSILALFIFLIGILLTVKGWYMITSMHNQILNAGFDNALTLILSAFFWVGLLINWLLTIIVTPVVILISTRQETNI